MLYLDLLNNVCMLSSYQTATVEAVQVQKSVWWDVEIRSWKTLSALVGEFSCFINTK